jgi:hypothetical protein
MIPALVLTAGLATRLRRCRSYGPRRRFRSRGHAVVSTHPAISSRRQGSRRRAEPPPLPHSITRHVGDGTQLGLRVRYSWEDPVLGSAGGRSERSADGVRWPARRRHS